METPGKVVVCAVYVNCNHFWGGFPPKNKHSLSREVDPPKNFNFPKGDGMLLKHPQDVEFNTISPAVEFAKSSISSPV